MKQTVESSPIYASSGMSHSEISIDPSNAARITKYLRDSIYSDKILAVIREASQNAQDEHIKFDVTNPVEINIHKEGDGYSFSVRDFAKGLDENDIRTVFASYGSSKKRSNNSQAGLYGVGAMASFSYSDTFFVTSYFEGTKTVYTCALGGDGENISVGHVYKINESQTTESGLEVTVPIKQQDLSTFSEKIRRFVSLSPYNITANILGEEITPIKPSFETKLGAYNMRVLKYDNWDERGKVFFQMGGNTYKTQKFSGTNGGTIKDGHIIIIDIPIGDCSVTLSRESFEETAKNKLVFDEIENLMQEYVANDAIQFKDKKIMDLVGDSISGMKKYESETFCYYAENLYADCWDFVRSIRLEGTGAKMEQNGKPVCIIIPSNGIKTYWQDKVDGYLKNNNLSAYVARCGKFSNPEVNETFDIVCARKVKYPKAQIGEKRFVVKGYRSRKVGTFTPLEFFNYISTNHDWNISADNIADAGKILAEKKKNAKSRGCLAVLTINNCVTRHSDWTTASSKFISELESLGFIAYGSQEYLDLHTKLKEKEEKKQAETRIINQATKNWYDLHPRLKKALKKERNAKKVGQFWDKIMEEQTTRGKIIQTFDRVNYDCKRLDRHELRQILKLA